MSEQKHNIGKFYNTGDFWACIFITFWIILTAGTPDVLDGITHKLMSDNVKAHSENVSK